MRGQNDGALTFLEVVPGRRRFRPSREESPGRFTEQGFFYGLEKYLDRASPRFSVRRGARRTPCPTWGWAACGVLMARVLESRPAHSRYPSHGVYRAVCAHPTCGISSIGRAPVLKHGVLPVRFRHSNWRLLQVSRFESVTIVGDERYSLHGRPFPAPARKGWRSKDEADGWRWPGVCAGPVAGVSGASPESRRLIALVPAGAWETERRPRAVRSIRRHHRSATELRERAHLFEREEEGRPCCLFRNSSC